jgi:hypothetical protein
VQLDETLGEREPEASSVFFAHGIELPKLFKEVLAIRLGDPNAAVGDEDLDRLGDLTRSSSFTPTEAPFPLV